MLKIKRNFYNGRIKIVSDNVNGCYHELLDEVSRKEEQGYQLIYRGNPPRFLFEKLFNGGMFVRMEKTRGQLEQRCEVIR